jgi:hypothetical protein
MLHLRGKVTVLALLCVVTLCGTMRAEDVELRYKYKEGEKLNYVMDQKLTMEMSVAGQDITMEMGMGITMVWKVDKVEKDGKAKMTQTMTRVQLKVKHPGGAFEWDSKDGTEPDDEVAKAMLPIFKAMAGADMTMTMDQRGQVSAFEMSDKLKEAMKKAAEAGGGGLGDFGTEDGMKKMMEQGSLVLPEGAISKGKSWNAKNEIKVPQVGKMITDVKYTYEGQEKRTGKQLEKVSGVITQSVEPDKNAPGEMKIKAQDSKANLYFDNEAGRLIETRMTQDVVMEFAIGGQTISQKLKQNLTIRLVDK